MTTVREIGQEYRSLEDKSGYKPSEEKLKRLLKQVYQMKQFLL